MLWTWDTKFIHRKLNFSIDLDHGSHEKKGSYWCWWQNRLNTNRWWEMWPCLLPISPQKPSTFPSISMPSWSKPIFRISCSVSIPRLNSRLVLNFSSSDFSILTGEERQGPGVRRILSQINGNFSSHFVNLKDGLSFQFRSLSGWVFIESTYSYFIYM